MYKYEKIGEGETIEKQSTNIQIFELKIHTPIGNSHQNIDVHEP